MTSARAAIRRWPSRARTVHDRASAPVFRKSGDPSLRLRIVDQADIRIRGTSGTAVRHGLIGPARDLARRRNAREIIDNMSISARAAARGHGRRSDADGRWRPSARLLERNTVCSPYAGLADAASASRPVMPLENTRRIRFVVGAAAARRKHG